MSIEKKMANKQKHNYSLAYNTRDQIKALAGSAKGRNLIKFRYWSMGTNNWTSHYTLCRDVKLIATNKTLSFGDC